MTDGRDKKASSDGLYRAILGTAALLAVLLVFVLLDRGPRRMLAPLPWFIPSIGLFQALTLFSVAFLGVGRYRVLRDPSSFWIGMGAIGYGITLVFYALTWPGLLPGGGAILGTLPSTSAWFVQIGLTIFAVSTLAAAVAGKPRGDLKPGLLSLSPMAAVALLILLCGLIIAWGDRLPTLVTLAGVFTPTLLVWNAFVAVLFAAGAVLSTRSYLRTRDVLLGYIAFAQAGYAFVVLATLGGMSRYDELWYLLRVILTGSAVIILFGMLYEYVRQVRREKERTAELLRTEEELRNIASFPGENPNPIIRVMPDGVVSYANKAAGPLLACWKTGVGHNIGECHAQTVSEALSSGVGKEIEETCDSQEFLVQFVPVAERGYVNIYGKEITLRKRAEEALKESEERFRLMADGSPVIMWVSDDNGNNHFVNRTYREFFGVTQEQAEGGNWHPLVHPDDASTYVETVLRAARERAAFKGEIRVLRADGEWRRLGIHAVPRFSPSGEFLGHIGIGSDITERVKAEEDLQRRTEELQAVMEALPVGVVITDARGGVVRTNGMDSKIWGTRPETRGVEDYHEYRAWWADTGEPLLPEEWASAQAVLRGESVVGQVLEIERFDGTRGFIINSASPIRDREGKIVGSAVSVQDITAIRETEKALLEEQEHKLEFYRRTIAAATGDKLVICEPAEIAAIAGPPVASWEVRAPSDIAIVRHGVSEIAFSAGLDASRTEAFSVAVGEAVTNAVKHAPEGEAVLHRADYGLTLVVSDRGSGIPALALPDVALRPGFSTAGTLGMGYKIMLQFADKVYLATSTAGTAVGLSMELHPAEVSTDRQVELPCAAW